MTPSLDAARSHDGTPENATGRRESGKGGSNATGRRGGAEADSQHGSRTIQNFGVLGLHVGSRHIPAFPTMDGLDATRRRGDRVQVSVADASSRRANIVSGVTKDRRSGPRPVHEIAGFCERSTPFRLALASNCNSRRANIVTGVTGDRRSGSPSLHAVAGIYERGVPSRRTNIVTGVTKDRGSGTPSLHALAGIYERGVSSRRKSARCVNPWLVSEHSASGRPRLCRCRRAPRIANPQERLRASAPPCNPKPSRAAQRLSNWGRVPWSANPNPLPAFPPSCDPTSGLTVFGVLGEGVRS
jgi:hypothetical protein